MIYKLYQIMKVVNLCEIPTFRPGQKTSEEKIDIKPVLMLCASQCWVPVSRIFGGGIRSLQTISLIPVAAIFPGGDTFSSG